MKQNEDYRICDVCGKKMTEGYVVNGCETYCSEECLKKEYSDDDINSFDIGGDESESYYTEWGDY